MKGSETDLGGPEFRFRNTLWTIVLTARDGDSTKARQALNRLFSAYWKPVYFYIRRQGTSVEDAKDLTQEFFAMFLDEELLAKVDPAKGRFRTFVLAVLQNFLGKVTERKRAQKRGGGRALISLDIAAVERELQGLHETPEDLFQRQWCHVVLETALEKLKAEMKQEGRGRQFEVLKAHLSGELPSHSELAVQLGISEPDVSNHLQRVRKRYQKMILAEVAAYVENPADVKEEVRELFRWAR